ncbi:uncharacterized protein N7459_006500 [Penicillium hispanicum]|uniref:uncharacterized protein n=1 Tax=Penicillium hispanicum TaxID=1080232 RepID=UPI002541D782|nr:uncharacterized protein N7459_006500 [Penicillium hispanicum]KAJ5577536.1 hypothetical protein N7459_006500 [Penicillium hispanicum]
MTHNAPAVVKVRGPDDASKSDHESSLQNQLQVIPRETKYLCIDENTPSDPEWALLSAHFSGVEDLEMNSGFDEELNDKNLPLHWPLQRLTLSSACAELVQSPFIRQGRVPHLSLFFTCGLRFEGPTSDALYREHRAAVDRGDKKAEYLTVREGTPDEKKIEITFLPGLVAEHMNQLYAGPEKKVDPENECPSGPINLKTLEIWENDAIDTFCRMTIALPHIVDNLQTLRIRSTSGLDFHYLDETPFRDILPQLEHLETLNLSVGEIFKDPAYLPTLYKIFPPNVKSLYFRGPVTLCQSEQWREWLDAFESGDFLPKLEHLAFVLDLHYEHKEASDQKKESKAPEELLQHAHEACEKLYEIARRRGISIVSMPAEPESNLLRPVDDRW